MYGPTTPMALETSVPTAIPVCRRHVGYVSMVRRVDAKKFTPTVHLIRIANRVAVELISGSERGHSRTLEQVGLHRTPTILL